MARILYLHGSSAGPFGSKTEQLERHGHLIVGRPRLPYPRHPRRSWRWLAAYFCQGWFRDAARYLAEETGATVVTTTFAPCGELEEVARRFPAEGPDAERVATLLVEDTWGEA